MRTSIAWHHGASPQGAETMDLESLKTKTYELWQELHKLHECVIPERAAFEHEIQQYGDMAEMETWQTAYAALKAKFLADSCLEDGQYLIEFYLLYASQKWGWRELLPDVLAQLEAIPEAVEAIADGLRTIGTYGCEYGTTLQDIEQFKETLINGTQQTRWQQFIGQQPAFSA